MNQDEQNEMEALEDEIVEMEDKLKRYREALERIASCESKFPGDVVDIAKNALLDA